jgi:hypothetical protein
MEEVKGFLFIHTVQKGMIDYKRRRTTDSNCLNSNTDISGSCSPQPSQLF